MTQRDKLGRLIKRFILAFAETHAGVLGDIAGVYMTFSDESYVTDLMMWQIWRKFSGVGIRDAIITFLLQDQGFLSGR